MLKSTNSDEMRLPQDVLASDLDGTLIPLGDELQNVEDLERLRELIRERNLGMVFVTGRHLASVQQAITEYRLPEPNWIICDVGTTICQVIDGQVATVTEYQKHLGGLVSEFPQNVLKSHLESIAALRLQEGEKQGSFKLSYYVDQQKLDETVNLIRVTLGENDAPYSVIGSVDPFNGDGLVDLLPANVSKAYALEWWCDFNGLSSEQIIFAGDSGNDLAAFLAGHRTIVVGNADRNIARQVMIHFKEEGIQDRLYLAESPATSGVLEGCQEFLR